MYVKQGINQTNGERRTTITLEHSQRRYGDKELPRGRKRCPAMGWAKAMDLAKKDMSSHHRVRFGKERVEKDSS